MNKPNKPVAKQQEKGGFLLGFIVGLLLGLAIALGVALYVAKVPIPFVDKVPQRSAEADAKEAAANKDWNPNAALPGTGKAPKPAAAASGVVAAPAQTSPAQPAASAPAKPAVAAAASAPVKTAPTAAAASAPATATGAYVFFVQAGAFTSANDAEQQRARLAMQGFNAKVYERASSEGKTVFRVRIGPFDEKAGADALLAQVQGAGLEAAVVRTQR